MRKYRDGFLKILLASCSVVGALYGVELALFFYAQIGHRLYLQYRYDWDIRPGAEVLAELRRDGQRAFPVVSATSFAQRGLADEPLWPLGAISRSTTVLGNENGTYTVYDSDEYGFRNPPGVYDRPIDIAVLGDSFAHGCCVEDEDTISGHLATKGLTALNMGLGGLGPLSEYAILREYVEPLAPRAVAWVFYAGNDLVDLWFENNQKPLRRYLQPGYTQGLADKQGQIDSLLTHYYWQAEGGQGGDSTGRSWWANFEVWSWVTLRGLRYHFGLFWLPADYERELYRERIALLAKLVAQAAADVDGWGGEFVFVCLPTYQHLKNGGFKPNYIEDIMAAMRAKGVPAVDMYDIFLNSADFAAYFPARDVYHPKWSLLKANHHFNGAGYGMVATEIAERLANTR